MDCNTSEEKNQLKEDLLLKARQRKYSQSYDLAKIMN
jgi:hypothetical protein